jgi:hypothetical protein
MGKLDSTEHVSSQKHKDLVDTSNNGKVIKVSNAQIVNIKFYFRKNVNLTECIKNMVQSSCTTNVGISTFHLMT